MRVSWEEAIQRGWVSSKEVAPPVMRSLSPAMSCKEDTLPKRNTAKKKRVDREGADQIVLIQMFSLKYPDLANRLMHIPNGGFRTKFERYHMVATGVRKGVPDLFLPVPNRTHNGLWIEFKAPEPFDSDVSESQKDWIDFLNANRFFATVAKGSDDAMQIIDDYLSQRQEW